MATRGARYYKAARARGAAVAGGAALPRVDMTHGGEAAAGKLRAPGSVAVVSARVMMAAAWVTTACGGDRSGDRRRHGQCAAERREAGDPV